MYKQQIKSNLANQVNIQGNNSMGQLGDVLENLADHKFNMIKNNKLNELQSVLNNSMGQLYNKYNTAPEELEKEFIKIKKNIQSNTEDPDIKLELEKQYLLTKDSYLSKANDNYNYQLDNQTRADVLGNINSLTQASENFYDKMYSNQLTTNDRADYEMVARKVNDGLMSRGTNGKYLFNEKDIESIDKDLYKAKVNTAYSHFNNLYEKDEDKFLEELQEWKTQPATIQERYGLQQKDYNTILNYIDGLETSQDNINISTNKQPNKQQAIALNMNMLEYGKTIDELQLTKNNGKYTINNEELPYLDKVNKLVEANYLLENGLNNGLKQSKYEDEKIKILNTTYNNFFDEEDIETSAGWFRGRKTINHMLVKFLNSELNDFEKNEKAEIYLNIATKLKDYNINLESMDDKDRTRAKTIIMQELNNQYDKPENEDFNTFFSNRKIQSQANYNQQVLNKVKDSIGYFGGNNE